MTQSEAVQGYYSMMVRLGIRLGVVGFALLGVALLLPLRGDAVNFSALALLLPLSVGFFWLSWFGCRLLPYLSSKVLASANGLEIARSDMKLQFQWQELRNTLDRPALQVLEVYAQDGHRVLAVDYYLNGFEELRQYIDNSIPAST